MSDNDTNCLNDDDSPIDFKRLCEVWAEVMVKSRDSISGGKCGAEKRVVQCVAVNDANNSDGRWHRISNLAKLGILVKMAEIAETIRSGSVVDDDGSCVRKL